jgi:hypothetical protein
MRTLRGMVLVVVVLAGLPAAPARAWWHGGWGLGINIGLPLYPPAYYYPPPCYYRPYPYYPVVVAPPPVVVQQAPVAAAPACATPAVAQAPPVVAAGYQAPTPGGVTLEPPLADNRQQEAERLLQQLANPNDRVRADSARQLGRLRVQRAVDPLMATLAGDRSAEVREEAARGLGLIASPKAVPALQRAAQLDPDRFVRHSAEFALDVIQPPPAR